MHNWDNATSLKETLRTFNDLMRCGKIRHIGVCNFAGHHLQKCVDYCEFMGLDPVINIQVRHAATHASSYHSLGQLPMLAGIVGSGHSHTSELKRLYNGLMHDNNHGIMFSFKGGVQSADTELGMGGDASLSSGRRQLDAVGCA